jgi:hypothetical protein
LRTRGDESARRVLSHIDVTVRPRTVARRSIHGAAHQATLTRHHWKIRWHAVATGARRSSGKDAVRICNRNDLRFARRRIRRFIFLCEKNNCDNDNDDDHDHNSDHDSDYDTRLHFARILRACLCAMIKKYSRSIEDAASNELHRD